MVVFDELWNYCGFEGHEVLALFEVVAQTGLVRSPGTPNQRLGYFV